MNKYERLAAKLANREKVIGTTMSMLNSPLLLEQMNREDLDFVLLDGEHGVLIPKIPSPCSRSLV